MTTTSPIIPIIRLSTCAETMSNPFEQRSPFNRSSYLYYGDDEPIDEDKEDEDCTFLISVPSPRDTLEDLEAMATKVGRSLLSPSPKPLRKLNPTTIRYECAHLKGEKLPRGQTIVRYKGRSHLLSKSTTPLPVDMPPPTATLTLAEPTPIRRYERRSAVLYKEGLYYLFPLN